MFYFDKLVEWGFDAARFTHIPNFVDCDAFEPQIDPGQRLLFFGRLSTEKGLHTLIDAASAAGVGIDIAGRGPLEQALRRHAAVRQADVNFLGFLSGEPLHAAIRASRAVVVPSEWYENAPLSVLEAFALGKPVIAASIGGLPEQVIDGESGWHFESGSRDALAARLREVVDAPDERIREFGTEALHRVRVNYSPQRYMDDIRMLYGEFGVLWN
jgi:glycosyltransferase involved in cell wall biosynthesis